jgi:hypothetical protein
MMKARWAWPYFFATAVKDENGEVKRREAFELIGFISSCVWWNAAVIWSS